MYDEGFLKDKLSECKMMPGARALIEHLHKHKIPMAICTSSDSKEFPKKIDDCKDLVEKVRLRDVIVGEDNLKCLIFRCIQQC
jgi:beta-phosphoglucomutase-like phosphatase (HAD superfamily)